MKQSTLFKAAQLLKSEDLELRDKAWYRLKESVDKLTDEVETELIQLLENKDCSAYAKNILVLRAINHTFSSKAQVMLVRLLANTTCQIAIKDIFAHYYGLRYTRNLSNEAEIELVSFLLQKDCPNTIKDFFWTYVDTYTTDCWYVPRYRNLSAAALAKLIDCLKDTAHREVAHSILMRYLDKCRGYAPGYNGNYRSHGFPKKQEVMLISLLKNEDCREIAKNILQKYVAAFRMKLSKASEVKLISLLWNKEHRAVAKELLLRYHYLHDSSQAWLDKLLTLSKLFKNQTCKAELALFYTKLQLA